MPSFLVVAQGAAGCAWSATRPSSSSGETSCCCLAGPPMRSPAPVTAATRPAREVLAEHPPGEDRVVDLGGVGPAVHVIGGEFIFEHDQPHPVLSLLPPLMHIPGAPAAAGELSAVVHMLANELTQPRPGSNTVITHLADVMFVHILRAWLAVNDDPRPVLAGRAPRRPDRHGPGQAARPSGPLLDRRVARRRGRDVPRSVCAALHQLGG